jgi:hypothetical protein
VTLLIEASQWWTHLLFEPGSQVLQLPVVVLLYVYNLLCLLLPQFFLHACQALQAVVELLFSHADACT